jgi:hypothetical protein
VGNVVFVVPALARELKFSETGDPGVVRMMEPVPVSAEMRAAGSKTRNMTGKAIAASPIDKASHDFLSDCVKRAPLLPSPVANGERLNLLVNFDSATVTAVCGFAADEFEGVAFLFMVKDRSVAKDTSA